MKNLENIPKRGKFETPDGYFDQLPNTIKERISETKKQESSPSFFQVLKPYLYFGSFFIILAFIIKSGINMIAGDYKNPIMPENSIAQNQIDYYELDIITEDLIYEELNNLETNTQENNISDDDILEYLIEEDINSLIDE